MNVPDERVLQKLREVREQLLQPEMPVRVDLREYLPPGSQAWHLFVASRGWTPGRRMKRATLIRWLDDLLGEGEAPPEADEPPEPAASPPAEEAAPPSPREVDLAGEREMSVRDAPAPRIESAQVEHALQRRAEASLDGDAYARSGDSGLPIDDGLDDWYYGPEFDEAAREERANLNAALREEGMRRQAEQKARAEAQPPADAEAAPAPAAPTAPAAAPAPVARAGEGQPLRVLTRDGIEYARQFLSVLAEAPDMDRTPPDDMLYDERYSRPFDDTGVTVEARAFRTRREAGAYLSEALKPIRHRVFEDAGLWSWLGMYYFANMVEPLAGRKWGTVSEAIVFSNDTSTTEATRSHQRRYRHWLRSAWMLYEQHPRDADFLLDENITTFNDLADRAFSNARTFTSEGVVPLLIQLYTDGAKLKPRYSRSRGGLRQLMRVLPQLELTYDVYGMEPGALLEVLPEEFRAWDGAA